MNLWSYLVAQGENAISLKVGIDLQPNGFSDYAAKLYNKAQFSKRPTKDLEDASKEGEKPLTSVTLVGHGIADEPGLYGQGKLMEKTVNGWKGSPGYENLFDANPDAFGKYIPTSPDGFKFPSFAAAAKGKRPFGCWFAKNAKVRFVGCNTEYYAEQFASEYLRKETAAAYGTTKFVWAGEKELGFFDTFDPPQPLKPLDGWYKTADAFNKSKYWKEFFGNN